MSLFDSFLLGALQGLTEFLPISSSGHLILAESWLKLDVSSLKSFDIAVHVGTLLAILVYFRVDVLKLWRAFWSLFRKNPDHETLTNQKLLKMLILATLPAIVVTLLFEDWIDSIFRNPSSAALMILSVGLLFFVVEWIAKHLPKRPIALKEGLMIGLAQSLALIPGVSRSGITISAGLVQGIKREEAARFSFLLGGIAILAGGVYAVSEVLHGKYAAPGLMESLIGLGTSFAFGLGAIAFLMDYLKKHTLMAFGIYRVLLGTALLIL